jgi:hypothetical protein
LEEKWGITVNKKVLLGSVLSLSLTFLVSSSAYAADNSWECPPETGASSYNCVSDYGYKGEDGFNVDRFSEKGIVNDKHSCTSFAAFMIFKMNPTLTAISTFDSAQYWDTQAVQSGVAVFGTEPHVGDIAQWEPGQNRTVGHVAYVVSVQRNANLTLNHIIIADDNSGLLATTRRKLYPGSISGVISWPHGFLTFNAPTSSKWGIGKPPFQINFSPLGTGN